MNGGKTTGSRYTVTSTGSSSSGTGGASDEGIRQTFLHWGLKTLFDESVSEERTWELVRAHISSLDVARLNGDLTSDEKFVGKKMKEKAKLLEDTKEVNSQYTERDFMLLIELLVVEDNGNRFRSLNPIRVWRRIRCSGGLNLRQFQDRVLAPAMGWSRNYHGYHFIDPKDGSQFGVHDSSSVDMMHINFNGLSSLPDVDVCLGELMNQQGDTMFYIHDFGDKFTHLITLEEVYDQSKSTGAVKLIDGSGACPPEDSFGFDKPVSYSV